MQKTPKGCRLCCVLGKRLLEPVYIAIPCLTHHFPRLAGCIAVVRIDQNLHLGTDQFADGAQHPDVSLQPRALLHPAEATPNLDLEGVETCLNPHPHCPQHRRNTVVLSRVWMEFFDVDRPIVDRHRVAACIAQHLVE